MNIIIENIKHKIIYIEYQDDLPFSVETIFFVTRGNSYWRPEIWDFFPNRGDKNNLMAYKSGGGGDAFKILAPEYARKDNASYWIDKSAEIVGIPQNIKKLKQPKLIKSNNKKSRNPFKVAEIVYDRDYCEVCGFESDEFCEEHKYIDDEGNEKYFLEGVTHG